MKTGEMRRHDALANLFEANTEMLNGKVVLLARQAEAAIDKIAGDNHKSLIEVLEHARHNADMAQRDMSESIDRKLSHLKSVVEMEIGGIAQETIEKKVAELKMEESRTQKKLTKLMETQQEELNTFRQDALAEVSALRQGVNTIGTATGVLPPPWRQGHVAWAP